MISLSLLTFLPLLAPASTTFARFVDLFLVTLAVLVQAAVYTRLDYCNSCLVGAPAYILSRLQSVLNASAQRIDFKIRLLVYKCLHGFAPPYISQYCIPTSSLSGRSHLRSAPRCDPSIPDF